MAIANYSFINLFFFNALIHALGCRRHGQCLVFLLLFADYLQIKKRLNSLIFQCFIHQMINV